MAYRWLNRLWSVPRNYLIRVDEGHKADNEISKSLEGRASVLGALEAERGRKLGRDLFVHILFFAIFIAILFMQRDVAAVSDMNNGVITALISQQIDYSLQQFPKTYLDVGQWDEYEDFILGVFVPGIQAMQDYSGRNLTESELWMVQYVNKVVGSVRVRQMRVKNDSCRLSHQFRNVSQVCYNKRYIHSTKETRPFGPAYNTSKYTYTHDAGGVKLYAHTVNGFWDTSGYVVDIPLDNNFGNRFQELVDDDFWGAPTRAMLITVTLISPNYADRAVVLYLLTEFTASGVATPFYQMRTFRIAMYIGSPLDTFRAFLEIVFLVLLTYYFFKLIEELIVSIRLKRVREFVTDLWNIIEFVNLIIFLASVIMYLQYLTSDRTSVDLSQKQYIVKLEHMGEMAIQFYQLSAINILLSALKTFRYLQLSPRLYVLWETMYEARIDMATYMVMFLIILLGFLLFGWLTFGPDLAEFNGFAAALGTLWQFLIGNPPDYGDLYLSNRILGPVYYALFTVFVFFILVNMFVAIVSNSYEVVTSRMPDRKTSVTSSDLKKPLKRFAKTLKAIYKRKPLYSETELLRMLQHKELLEKDTLTKQEIAQELKAMGEEPLSLYIERLLAVHAKRKKIISELKTAERQREKEEMEDEFDRRIFRQESLGNLMNDIDLDILEDEDNVLSESNTTFVQANTNTSEVNNNNNNNNNTNGNATDGNKDSHTADGAAPLADSTPTTSPTGVRHRNTLGKSKGKTLAALVDTMAHRSTTSMAQHNATLSHRIDSLEAKLDAIIHRLGITVPQHTHHPSTPHPPSHPPSHSPSHGSHTISHTLSHTPIPSVFQSSSAPQTTPQSQPKPEFQPEPKPEFQPEPKPEFQPEPKPESKPEAKSEPKPESKPETKSEPKPDQPSKPDLS